MAEEGAAVGGAQAPPQHVAPDAPEPPEPSPIAAGRAGNIVKAATAAAVVVNVCAGGGDAASEARR